MSYQKGKDKTPTRLEKDSIGTIEVPENALYGAHTQRAVLNFPISDLKMPPAFIQAMGLIKAACAKANSDLKLLDAKIATPIIEAALEISKGNYSEQFPIDVFQTGSGTSTNMNVNEVISHIAKQNSANVHPNDHVNMSQSSNDVIPTAIHVSASIEVQKELLPALEHLLNIILKRSESLKDIVKTGRTHLMDAMPVTLGQELSGWSEQIRSNIARIQAVLPHLHALALGGTAVGTGLNAHPKFSETAIRYLAEMTNIPFSKASNYFEAMSSQDTAVELSGQLKTLAVSLMKIANDLRWMNSGPLAGLREIALPTLQAGSSIMPGKVNPVVSEAVCMVCAKVIGNDVTITLSGQAGNFQLNTMLPVIAYSLLQSINLLSASAKLLADKAITGFEVNIDKIKEQLDKNPILVTALNTVIGYEKGAEIAKRAYRENRPVIDVALEMTNLSKEELKKLLDPMHLTKGGIPDSTYIASPTNLKITENPKIFPVIRAISGSNTPHDIFSIALQDIPSIDQVYNDLFGMKPIIDSWDPFSNTQYMKVTQENPGTKNGPIRIVPITLDDSARDKVEEACTKIAEKLKNTVIFELSNVTVENFDFARMLIETLHYRGIRNFNFSNVDAPFRSELEQMIKFASSSDSTLMDKSA